MSGAESDICACVVVVYYRAGRSRLPISGAMPASLSPSARSAHFSRFAVFRSVRSRHGTGSLGHQVNGSFGSSLTSGAPGHHIDPV